MHTKLLALGLAAALTGLDARAHAQTFTTIARESFDYTAGSLLANQAGGSGFLVPWFTTPSGAATITSPGFDAIGNRATTVPLAVNPQEVKSESFRRIDQTGFGPIAESIPGTSQDMALGADGAILWISFTARRIAGGDDTFGGLSLFQFFGPQGGEKLFLGSPFVFFEWGFDDQAGSVQTVAGSNVDAQTRLVYRFDHLSGKERLRLYLNPATPHPSGPADLDALVPDFRWNEIRIGSGDGGNGGATPGYEYDNIVIECQDCAPPPTLSFSGTPAQVSVSAGGTQAQTLDAGVANALLPYLILGTASGTTPGFPIDGLVLPINIDSLTLVSLNAANSAVFQNTFGLLDGNGKGAAAIAVPAGTNPNLAGLTLDFAYAVLRVNPFVKAVFTSVPVSLALLP